MRHFFPRILTNNLSHPAQEVVRGETLTASTRKSCCRKSALQDLLAHSHLKFSRSSDTNLSWILSAFWLLKSLDSMLNETYSSTLL